jgi:hypothetical protein
MGLFELQQRIDKRLRGGGSLADVEREIIDPSPFSEEQRAALWLHASALRPRDPRGARHGRPGRALPSAGLTAR